jgi:hypothetical protein
MKKAILFYLLFLLFFNLQTAFVQGKPDIPPGHQPVLNEEQKRELLDFTKKYTPFAYNRLQELKEIDPIKYEHILIQKYRQMMELKKLQKSDPDAYKDSIKAIQLDEKSMELSKKYRETNNKDEKNKILGELKVVLNELFDLREKERERRIKQLEDEIKHLKDLLASRRKNKDVIIQKKIDELTGKSEQTEW